LEKERGLAGRKHGLRAPFAKPDADSDADE
jgi:hypothetical protein